MLLGEHNFGLCRPITISVRMPWFVAHHDPKTGLTLALCTWAKHVAVKFHNTQKHCHTWHLLSLLPYIFLTVGRKKKCNATFDCGHITCMVTAACAVWIVDYKLLNFPSRCSLPLNIVLNFMLSPPETGLPKAQASWLEHGFYRLPCWWCKIFIGSGVDNPFVLWWHKGDRMGCRILFPRDYMFHYDSASICQYNRCQQYKQQFMIYWSQAELYVLSCVLHNMHCTIFRVLCAFHSLHTVCKNSSSSVKMQGDFWGYFSGKRKCALWGRKYGIWKCGDQWYTRSSVLSFCHKLL
jgi:hypothetical protein